MGFELLWINFVKLKDAGLEDGWALVIVQTNLVYYLRWRLPPQIQIHALLHYFLNFKYFLLFDRSRLVSFRFVFALNFGFGFMMAIRLFQIVNFVLERPLSLVFHSQGVLNASQSFLG